MMFLCLKLDSLSQKRNRYVTAHIFSLMKTLKKQVISVLGKGKGNAESGGYPFGCSWTPDEVHHNHGNGAFDDYNDFIRCADIHMEREYGLKRRDDEE